MMMFRIFQRNQSIIHTLIYLLLDFPQFPRYPFHPHYGIASSLPSCLLSLFLRRVCHLSLRRQTIRYWRRNLHEFGNQLLRCQQILQLNMYRLSPVRWIWKPVGQNDGLRVLWEMGRFKPMRTVFCCVCKFKRVFPSWLWNQSLLLPCLLVY